MGPCWKRAARACDSAICAKMIRMLHVHFSNRLETLLDRAVHELTGETLGVFERQTIVVPSQAMGQWVTLGLARQQGVATLLDTPLPGGALTTLHQRLLPDHRLDAGYERGALSLRIFDHLMQRGTGAGGSALDDYLAAAPRELPRLRLAQGLAACFDQALVFRPDRLLAWEAEDEPVWQADLWRLLAGELGTHRARGFELLREAIAAAPAAALPRRLLAFGFHTLPPVWLNLMMSLAERVPVHLFVPTPSQEYWAGLDTPAALARRAARGESTAHRAVGHPLLATLGRQGAAFIDALSELPGQVSDHFVDPCETGRSDLLAQLQADLLALRDPAEGPSRPLVASDDSIQVHCCAGPLREVEVLHDRLRDLLDRDATLNPSDIVVMTPDIDRYAPYVDAVFGSRSGDLSIAYRIADRAPAKGEPVVAGFLAWLALPDRRYAVNAVLDVLECPPVARRLGLSVADRDLLRDWARRSAVHWGLDGTDKLRLGLPPEPAHTWRRGLDRLLLGAFVPEEACAAYADVAPVEAVDSAMWGVLGRLADWIDALRMMHQQWASARPMSDWATILGAAAEELFSVVAEEEYGKQLLRDALAQVARDALAGDCHRSVPLEVFKAALDEKLSMAAGRSGFMGGGVQFCAMVPLRSLPFAVVCLLGLDHDALPRHARPAEFDPFADERRPGDRNRREDDAYLFLEAILSARQTLYLSYNGREVRDFSDRPPSVLLAQLMETISAGAHFEQPGDWRERRLLIHPLHGFSARNFDPQSPFFSYRTDLGPDQAAAPMTAETESLRPAMAVAGADEVIDLADLLGFWRHPVRHVVRRHLDIDLDLDEDVLLDQEDFDPDSLDLWQIRDWMLGRLRKGMPPEAILAHLRVLGRLPPGPWGLLLGREQLAEAEAIHARLAPHGPDAPRRTVAVDLRLHGWRVLGQLPEVSAGGILTAQAGDWRAKHEVAAWLTHLILNAAAPAGVLPHTVGVGRKGRADWAPLPDAADRLLPWLTHYRAGLTTAPVPLLPEVLMAARTAHDADDQLAAMRKAYAQCLEPGRHTGQAADAYLAWVYGEGGPITSPWREVALSLVAGMPSADGSGQ